MTKITKEHSAKLVKRTVIILLKRQAEHGL